MLRVIGLIGLLAVAPLASAVQVERDADIHHSLEGDSAFLGAVVGMIRGYGYKCDTLSTVYPFLSGGGFRVGCNNWSIFYELEDQGNNRWLVRRK